MNRSFKIPIAVLTDSYKATHHLMYPEADVMTAYGEFRRGFNKDTKDTRFIAYGMQYLIENYICVQWTKQDVDQAELFFATHNAGFTNYPFPKELFEEFIAQNNGYFPVTIQSLPEGSVANAHVPLFQITAEEKFSRLVTFLETLLTQLWYPATVATLSRRVKDIIESAFIKSVDSDMQWLLDSKLHDFGFRGCSSVEQSIIGCCAHLLNFTGTDTMSGAYYAQFNLNNGKPVAQSIPATEHSVMTAWNSEKDAINNMIDQFGGKDTVYSVVMDSYDYKRALYDVLPNVKIHHIQRDGHHIVLRPDSGDPVEAVMMGLHAASQVFGYTVNSKGYRVIKNASVIQGDGIDINIVEKILQNVLAEGYSAQCVTFGMGAGLLQKVNRDTMSFATKLSCVVTADNDDDDDKNDDNNDDERVEQPNGWFKDSRGYHYDKYLIRPVMKLPSTDAGKYSLPGKLRVVKEDEGLTVYPDYNVFPRSSSLSYEDDDDKDGKENNEDGSNNKNEENNKNSKKIKNYNSDNKPNELITVYDKGPVKGLVWDSFDIVKKRVETEWKRTKPTHNPISTELQQEIDYWKQIYRDKGEETL